MSEMIERVARAICKAERYDVETSWEVYVKDARAAIAAMREPTFDMLNTFTDHMAAEEIWIAMIEAALSEETLLRRPSGDVIGLDFDADGIGRQSADEPDGRQDRQDGMHPRPVGVGR
jgi:hypothetical protein